MELTQAALQRIIRTTPGDFAVCRTEGNALRTIFLSPGLHTLAGMEPAEFRACTEPDPLGIVLERDRPLILLRLEALLRDPEGADSLTCRILHGKDGFTWLRIRARAAGTLDGAPVLVALFFSADEELRAYADLLDHANTGVYVVEKDTWELLYANLPCRQAWGRDNFRGRACYDFVCGRAAPCPWCSIPRMKEGLIHESEAYVPGFDKWFRIDCREMDWFGRKAVAVYSVDVTEQKLRAQSLEVDKKSLETVVGSIPVGVGVCLVRNGTITQVTMNAQIRELLELPEGDVPGSDRAVLGRIHRSDAALVQAQMERLSQPNNHIRYTFRYFRSGAGACRWYQMEAQTVARQEGVMVFVCLSDVTAEQEAVAAVRDSRRMYAAAVEAAGLVVWEYDIRAHRILFSDDTATGAERERVGMPRTIENVPEAIAGWVDERDMDKLREMYRALQDGAPESSCECWYKAVPGQVPRCQRIIYTAVPGRDGKPGIAYGISQDITAQKQEEEKYNRFIREIIDSHTKSLGAFRLNLTKNLCGEGHSADPTILALQDGGSADRFFAAAAAHITDPAIRERYRAAFSRTRLLDAFRDGQTQFSCEYPITLADGSAAWLQVYFSLIQNPATGDVEALTYSHNITEQKREEDIARRMIRENCDFVGLIDPEKRTFEFRNLNGKIRRFPLHRKMNYDECVRYDLEHYVAWDNRDHFTRCASLERITRELQRGREYLFTFAHSEDGGRFRKQLRYCWLSGREGEILAVQTDVTSAYEQEQERMKRLESALKAAETANRAKSEFLSRISHDIRTPMNVISGMTNFALEDLDDREKLLDDLKKIQTSNGFLLSLINDILDISKIDSGKMELHPEPYPYEEYMGSIRGMFEPLCREKGLKFVVVEERVNGTVIVDRIRFNQIALNLLSNAVKFTPAGGTVTYTAKEERLPGERLRCTVRVRDTGIGMSEAFQKRMFEPFSQETPRAGGTLREQGTGLGLSIVKRIVDLMGGTISVKSAPGQGTDIAVTLVLPEAAADSLPPKKAPGRAGPGPAAPEEKLSGLVLVAEDHPVNAEIAQRLLKSFGLESEVAENGTKAVERFAASAPGRYRAVLMDIQMPELNGYEAARRIRALDRPDAGTVPILAMTADAYAEDVAKAREAGMNAHIAKPLDPVGLRKTLGEFLTSGKTEAETK